MRKLRIALIAVLLAGSLFVPFSQLAFGKGSFLLFVGQDKESILGYLNQVEKHLDGFMGYTSVQNLEGITEPADSGVGIQHFDYFFEKVPGRPISDRSLYGRCPGWRCVRAI